MDQSQTPEPGDLIEIFRGLYQHWAVYVGDGDVVHLTTTGAEIPGGISSSLRSSSNKKGVVRRHKLQEAVGGSTWTVNNILDEKYRPRSRRIIVKEALRQVKVEMRYSVFKNNCEHFATKLRYGIKVSLQVAKAVATATIWPIKLPLKTAVEFFRIPETE